MVTAASHASSLVDREYVAVCIAAELVRLRVSADRHGKANPQAGDISLLIAQPLQSIADALGISTQVESLVGDVLPGASSPIS